MKDQVLMALALVALFLIVFFVGVGLWALFEHMTGYSQHYADLVEVYGLTK